MQTTVIAIYNPKGGVGKTETAVALATGIAAKHAHEGRDEPVLLVDLDRQGNCAHRLRVHQLTYDPDTNPDGPCISALLTGRVAIEDSILQDVRPNLDLLPSTPEIAIAIVVEKGGSGSLLANAAVDIINAWFTRDGTGATAAGEDALMR